MIPLAKLLLFNIQDPAKRSQLQVLSLRLNFTMIDVAPDRQHCRVRDLLSGLAAGSAPASQAFTDEMLVMNGFDSADLNFFLNELRRAGHTVRLNAVVTETNQLWSARQLHDTILAESLAMAARPGSNPPQK